jgi:hypothetical protein
VLLARIVGEHRGRLVPIAMQGSARDKTS